MSADDPASRRSVLSGKPSFARLGLDSGDLLVLAAAFFFCTAIGPFFVFPTYTPRMVLVLLAALPGVVALLRLARRGDRAAVAACSLATWILVAAMLSGAPRLALGGAFGRESSALIAIAALGLWALGRELSEPGWQLLAPVLLSAFVLSALVGALQILLTIDTGVFARTDGRPGGFTTNPVYFGSLMGGAAALSASQWRQRRHPQVMLGLVGVFAFAVNLSGSRVALIASVLVLAYITARAGWKLGWHLPVAYVIGTLVSVGFVSAVGDGGQGATARVASGSSSGRLDVWRYGWSAFTERPLFGWGLGRFRAAIQEHMSADFVRVHAPNDRVPIVFDAHNIVVELTVTLGIVGLVLAAVFAWYAGRRASGALAAFAVVIAVSWLLQPAALSTLPVAMIALGASRREAAGTEDGELSSALDAPGEPPTPASTSSISAIAFGVGVLPALWLVVADLRLNAALDAMSAQRIDAAAAWFPTDPVISDLVAQAWFVEEEFDQTLRPDVLEWSNRTTDVEPDRAYWWARLAGRQLAFGDLDGVKSSLDEALERQPWHSLSWALMELYAVRADDPALEARAHSKLCALGVETDCG